MFVLSMALKESHDKLVNVLQASKESNAMNVK